MILDFTRMQSVLYELHVSQSQFSHCPRQIWMAWLQMEPTILALWWYSSRLYSGASSWILGLEDGCTSDQFIGGSVGNRWSLLKNGLENRLKSAFCLNYSDTQDSMILKLMISWKILVPVVMTHTFCILECFDPSAHEQLLHSTMECKRWKHQRPCFILANCWHSEGSRIFLHIKSFCCTFLFSPTNFRTKADFASQLPFACMDLEADKPLRKVRGSCHIFRGRC